MMFWLAEEVLYLQNLSLKACSIFFLIYSLLPPLYIDILSLRVETCFLQPVSHSMLAERLGYVAENVPITCTDSVKFPKRSPISEVFHTSTSAAADTMQLPHGDRNYVLWMPQSISVVHSSSGTLHLTTPLLLASK